VAVDDRMTFEAIDRPRNPRTRNDHRDGAEGPAAPTSAKSAVGTADARGPRDAGRRLPGGGDGLPSQASRRPTGRGAARSRTSAGRRTPLPTGRARSARGITRTASAAPRWALGAVGEGRRKRIGTGLERGDGVRRRSRIAAVDQRVAVVIERNRRRLRRRQRHPRRLSARRAVAAARPGGTAVGLGGAGFGNGRRCKSAADVGRHRVPFEPVAAARVGPRADNAG